MKENKLIIASKDGKETYDILFNIELDQKHYLIYTKHEQNEWGDIITYAGDYEFVNGKQLIKPIEEEEILECLDAILMQVECNINKGDMNE